MPLTDPLAAGQLLAALDGLIAARVRDVVADVLAELGDPGRLLSITDAAQRLSCSRETVGRWIADGRLPTVELPSTTGGQPLCRIRQADLAALGSTTRRRSDAHKEVPNAGGNPGGKRAVTLPEESTDLLSLDAALARKRARQAAQTTRDKKARSV